MSIKGVVLVSVMVAMMAVMVKIYPSYPTGRMGVLFYYCTSSHQDRKEMKATKESLASLPFSPSTPMTIVIHGFTESSVRSWVVSLTDALLAHDSKSVVILVDYWDLTTISRPYMMGNVRHIADVTAHLIDLLVEEKGVRLTNVHVIGFSLGGRISGLVGERIQTGTLGRITVEHICSHYRAVWLMIEAVEHAGQGVFPACGCPDWESFQDQRCDCQIVNNFGLFPNNSALGNFFFSTHSVPPYSKPL